jgi:Secretion system C-terminal sorting domain
MSKAFATIALLLAGTVSFSQDLIFPGVLCCDQDLCPGDPIPLIREQLGTNPSDSVIAIEYRWAEFLIDTASPNGSAWVPIPGATEPTFQPMAINNPYGGFFMRSARKVGTTNYLSSNIITIRQLSATAPECLSAADEPVRAAGQRTVVLPNPAHNSVTFSAKNVDNQPFSLHVYSSAGQVCYQTTAYTTAIVQLDISTWPAGLYLTHVRYADGFSEVLRWLKQ